MWTFPCVLAGSDTRYKGKKVLVLKWISVGACVQILLLFYFMFLLCDEFSTPSSEKYVYNKKLKQKRNTKCSKNKKIKNWREAISVCLFCINKLFKFIMWTVSGRVNLCVARLLLLFWTKKYYYFNNIFLERKKRKSWKKEKRKLIIPTSWDRKANATTLREL